MTLYLAGEKGEIAVATRGPDGWRIVPLFSCLPPVLALARHPNGRILFAAHVGRLSVLGADGAGICAQADVPATRPSGLAVSRDGNLLLLADKGVEGAGGQALAIPLGPDGSPAGSDHAVRLPGYPTGVTLAPCGEFVLLPTPASHAIHILRLHAGRLFAHRIVPRPGDAPRQVAFHPNLDLLYVANGGNGISACHWQAAAGFLTGAQTMRTVARGSAEDPGVSALTLLADGRHMFAAHRAQAALATVAVQRGKGKMAVRRLDRLGAVPDLLARNPDGTRLLLGRSGDTTLHAFTVEGRYAMLAKTDLVAPFPITVVG